MIKEKIVHLDELTQDKVSVVKQKVIVVENVEYPMEGIWRTAYINSERGRAQVEKEIPEPYLSAIMSMWGDSPTINEATATQ